MAGRDAGLPAAVGRRPRPDGLGRRLGGQRLFLAKGRTAYGAAVVGVVAYPRRFYFAYPAGAWYPAPDGV